MWAILKGGLPSGQPCLPCHASPNGNTYFPSKWSFLQLQENTVGDFMWNLVLGEGPWCFLYSLEMGSPYFLHGTASLMTRCFQVTFLQFQPRCSAQALHGTTVWHLWCWQQLGTHTSLPLKSILCWNRPISRCTDLLLDSAVHSLSFSCVCHRWNMGTMPLCGTQRCWSTWPSTTRSAPSTRWGTRWRTEGTGSPCSTAAPTETSSHKGRPLEQEEQVLRESFSQLWTRLLI